MSALRGFVHQHVCTLGAVASVQSALEIHGFRVCRLVTFVTPNRYSHVGHGHSGLTHTFPAEVEQGDVLHPCLLPALVAGGWDVKGGVVQAGASGWDGDRGLP